MAGGASEKLLETMATSYLYGKPCIIVSGRKTSEGDGNTYKVHSELLRGHLAFDYPLLAPSK